MSRDDLARLPDPVSMGSRHYPIHLNMQVETIHDVISVRRYKSDNWRYYLDNDGKKLLATWTMEQDNADQYWSDEQLIKAPVNHGLAGFLICSTDQTVSSSPHIGDNCFLCSNGMMESDFSFSRKSTANAMEDIRNNMWDMMDTVHVIAAKLYKDWNRWYDYDLSSRFEADHLVIKAAEDNVINWRDIPHVLEHWKTPEHNEFKERNLGNFVQAITSHQRTKSPFQLSSFSKRLKSFANTVSPEPKEVSNDGQYAHADYVQPEGYETV